jgi:sulfite exporter TauE/SafE
MTLLFGVLVASLVGSVHCAAMCGAFVCLYARGSIAERATGHVAYNAGRLVSYVALGLVAGALGARVDRLGALVDMQRAAAIVAGVLMVGWAAALIASTRGARRPAFGAPDWIKRRFGEALVALRDQPPSVRAGLTGLFTTVLPCGWLYTFVVTAGGTGSAIAGAAVMLAFWLGTLPMMLGVGLGVGRIARPVARHLPVASAVAVLLLGALSIAGKLTPPTAASMHAAHARR